MHLEALIFDLDGTLVDTAPDLLAATNHVLTSQGREAISEKQLREFVGHGAMDLIRRGLTATGGVPDDETLKKLHGELLKYYGSNIAVHSRVFDGIPKLLQRAKARGLKMGICTNKVESLSRKLIAEIGLSDYFGAVVGGDSLPVMKPDPGPYLEVARLLNVDPKHTMMFGDSETDIKTAKAAGVPVVAVSFGQRGLRC